MVQTYKKSIHEIKGDKEWSALERGLLENCRKGIAHAGKRELPDPKDISRHVRPELITYLLLGGCDDEEGGRPPAEGVALLGATLTGELKFAAEVTRFDLAMSHCRLPRGVTMRDAQIGSINLTACHVSQGLDLHRLTAQKSVMLIGKTKVIGGVDLGCARISGQLNCEESQLISKKGDALNCNGARIEENVHLDDGFVAKGLVDLGSALIGGQLSCRGGRFRANKQKISRGRALNCTAASIGADVFLDHDFTVMGDVKFVRAQIQGSLKMTRATFEGALDLDSAKIGVGLFIQRLKGVISVLSLTDAKLGTLRDDAVSWNAVKEVHLGGLTYDRIDSDMPFDDRIDTWAPLDRVGGPTDYDPQPLTQLANVLERMGRRKEAARARYRREKLVGLWQRDVWRNEPKPSWRAAWQLLRADTAALVDRGFRWMFGYGHYPALALVWTSAIIAFAYVLYGATYTAHQMAPNSDVVLTSPVWQTILSASDTCAKEVAADCVAPLEKWTATPTQVDYESFSPFLYAVDLFVPLDALGQESTWTPSKDRGLLGWWAYWMRMPIQVMGWVIAAVGAAVVTGVIGRKDR